MQGDEEILWFSDVKKDDVGIAGGKAANLGEMTQAKFPIPPGFIVTAEAYFKYLKDSGIRDKVVKMADSIDVDNTRELKEETEKIRTLIKATMMGNHLEQKIAKAYRKLSKEFGEENVFVAVRSSATAEDLPEASFAGQQDTYLNVSGIEELLNHVQRCWASLFTARATYYRNQNDFKTEEVGIAVVVQVMVNSECAGVMFTADPTGDTSKIIIEAAYGLGEAVVSGSVTPDTYVVSKENMRIANKTIGKQQYSILRDEKGKNYHKELEEGEAKKQKIDDELILELGKIGKTIEDHYEKPQDIEWATEEGKLFITQSRPITTLGLKEKVGEEQKLDVAEDKKLVKGLSGCPGIVSGVVKVVPSVEDVAKVKEGDILVTKMTNPDWVPIMKKATGIITNEGGTTCHAAIVSRELGIPCIVGSGDATEKLKDGLLVTMNAYQGDVYEGKVEVKEEKKEEKEEEIIKEEEVGELEKALDTEECKSCTTGMGVKEKLLALLDEHAARVKVNVALPEAAKRAAETNADGVGLLRAEHMITESGMHPAEFIRQGKKDELVETVKKGIQTVLDEFKDKPVWYRTFDARTDEFTQLEGGEKEPEEDNPMLGWHGIRRDLDDREMLEAQFLAVKKLVEEGYHHIGIMLPFVQSVDEYKKAKEIAEKVGLKRKRKVVEFGVMVETPAACWIVDELIEEGIDFVSFGTNDLTQLTLGIDRNNERIQKAFSELHPAVLGEIEMVIGRCKGKVKTSICGQAGSNPKMVRKLVRMGINSVSANIDAVQEIKRTVITEEKKILMEKIRE